MDLESVSEIVMEAMKVTIYVSLPTVGLGLLTGLLVSVFQAITQIQEQTLTFVPKMIAVLIVLAITFPWMYHVLMNMTLGFLGKYSVVRKMILSIAQLMVLVLVMARLFGMFMSAPVFSNRQILVPAKVAMMLWISGMILFLIPVPNVLPQSFIQLALALGVEFLVGVMFGFLAQLILVGVEIGGALVDTQAGISAAALLDPTRGQTTIISKMYREIVILFFLLMNGHHIVLLSVRSSFELMPIGSGFPQPSAMLYLIQLGGLMFKVAVQFAAPILIVIFILDFCFGMLSRVAPQINVFQLSFQLKPIVMVFVLMLIVPGLMYGVEQMMSLLIREFMQFSALVGT